MSSASATSTTPATGGFTEAAFEAFLKGRDEPSWLRRPATVGLRSLPRAPPAQPPATRSGGGPTSGPSSSPDSPRRPRAKPSAEDRSALAPAWETLSGHYATGLEQINATPTRSADPAKLGGAILIDLATAAKDSIPSSSNATS